ncbi:HNH endonuclease [Pantoea agglomerans]|uniref:HNH endonuclease n=1 Tax=Enterobacter agglomerans TaxID=549 RepID=UPI001785E7FA|nr:HNH endonuclease [Pantoea agglomerans]MBD8129780.1 HNH endonuclease [Pantoea agglomerans]WLO83448.1 HNH endonuclease [Pantoea agglomerans]
MKNLPLPSKNYTEMLNKCASGMLQINVKDNFLRHIPLFLQKENQYQTLSSLGKLFTYPKTVPLNDLTQVVGNLTKSKLENLYVNNLRNKDKPARNYYDELLVSSGELCPFCGDIGYTRNLDHFLPVAHFPEFSVMPINLVPSCRDCNMGEKGAGFAITEGEQAIHPYIDKDIFFKEQWVFANYTSEDIGAVTFFVRCPEAWGVEDKLRANYHFLMLNIGNRYRLEAGKHLSDVMLQRNAHFKTFRSLFPEITIEQIMAAFIQIVLQPIIDSEVFPNQWKKVMYQCLANSEEFFNFE